MCDFTVLRELGSGAYGSVFVVNDGTKSYAVKLTTNSLCQLNKVGISPNEYTILFNLRHKNLSNAVGAMSKETLKNCFNGKYKVGILSEIAYSDLAKIYETRYDLIDMIYDIACGIEALHDAGYYHLDIKGANCLFFTGDNQRAVLSDFGLAIDTSVKEYDSLVCTVTHRPPEVKRNETYKLTPYIDVFSFGVLMAEMTRTFRDFYSFLPDEKFIEENILRIHDMCNNTIEDVRKNFKLNTTRDPDFVKSGAGQNLSVYREWVITRFKSLDNYLEILSMILKATSRNPTDRGTITEYRQRLHDIIGKDAITKAVVLNNVLNDLDPFDFEVFQVMRRIMLLPSFEIYPVRMLFSAFHIYMTSKEPIRKIKYDSSPLTPYHIAFAYLTVAAPIYGIKFEDTEYYDNKETIYRYFHYLQYDTKEYIPTTNIVTFKEVPYDSVICILRDFIASIKSLNFNFNGYNAFDTCETIDEIVSLVNGRYEESNGEQTEVRIGNMNLLKNIYKQGNIINERKYLDDDIMSIEMKYIDIYFISDYEINDFDYGLNRGETPLSLGIKSPRTSY